MPDESKDLEHDFEQEMYRLYEIAKKECGYNAAYFLQMLREKGAVDAAKQLLRSKHAASGLTKLYECRRLDLSLEAVVCENPKWHPLFTEQDIETARERLIDLGYHPKATNG